MVNGGIAFNAKKLRNRDTARLRHPSEFVTEQINDHQVFRLLLGVLQQHCHRCFIGRPVDAACRSAFHGPRRQSPGFQSEEEFRRKGRSEEHTSELQSLMRISYAVFCLKKKKNETTKTLLIYNIYR